MTNMTNIKLIKFYFCDICGEYYDKEHPISHDNDDEYIGYEIYYNDYTNIIFIKNTYSSQDSVNTDDNHYDYFYEGNKDELLTNIEYGLDIRMENRFITIDDCDFNEINVLYSFIIKKFS